MSRVVGPLAPLRPFQRRIRIKVTYGASSAASLSWGSGAGRSRGGSEMHPSRRAPVAMGNRAGWSREWPRRGSLEWAGQRGASACVCKCACVSVHPRVLAGPLLCDVPRTILPPVFPVHPPRLSPMSLYRRKRLAPTESLPFM